MNPPKIPASTRGTKTLTEELLFHWQWKSLDTAALLLSLFLFIYAVTRAGNEMRWSCWAYGDAQHLNGAIHFRDEGFIANRFLMFSTPGYIHDHIYNNRPNGRYTHYPTLHTVIAGLCAKIFGDPLYPARRCAVFFGSVAIFSWFLFARQIFGRGTAFLSAVYIAFAVMNLDFVDSISNHAYDWFFAYSGLFLTVMTVETHKRQDRQSVSNAFFIALCAIMFLEMCNSVEYVLYLLVFMTGYSAARGNFRAMIVKIVCLTAVAVIALILHFLQVVWEWGSFERAFADFAGTASSRITGVFEPSGTASEKMVSWIHFLGQYARHLGTFYTMFYGSAFLGVSLYWTMRLIQNGFTVTAFNSEMRVKSLTFLSLALSGSIFWIILPSQSYRMGIYTPMFGFPTLALLFAWTAIEAGSDIKNRVLKNADTPLLKRAAIFLVAGLSLYWTILPFKKSYEYFLKYPNPLGSSAWRWGLPNRNPEGWKEAIRQARLIGQNTQWGDLVMVPNDSCGSHPLEGNPVEEFYAQRRFLKIGEDEISFRRTLDILKDYKARFSQKIPAVSGLQVWVWVDTQRVSAQMAVYLSKNLKGRIIEPGRLYLFRAE